MAVSTSRSRCDPCGIVCVICIYLIVIYTDYAFIKWIVLPLQGSLWSIIITIAVFQLILILLVWSHMKASISDPGVVPHPTYGLDFSSTQLLSKKDDNDHNWSVCVRCQMYRPPRAHHCRICQRCVRKMDHHCPWINNCVGELNQKYFILFLVYTGIEHLIYALAMLLVIQVLLYFLNQLSSLGMACTYTLISIIIAFIKSKLDSHQRMIHTSVLLIEALLFGLFVVAVLTDQIQAVFANESAIDRFRSNKSKDSVKTKVKSKKLMSEVCGPGPIIWWMFPCERNQKYYSNSSDFIV